MIARFETLERLKPETFRAHLRNGNGAVLVERFLWGTLAKLDRQDMLFGDAERRTFTLATRTMNSGALFQRVAEAFSAECPNYFGYEPDVRVSAPGAARQEDVYEQRADTTLCLLFLDPRDQWTAAPIIHETAFDVPRGSVLIMRGDLAFGFTENVDPESRVTLAFGLDIAESAP